MSNTDILSQLRLLLNKVNGDPCDASEFVALVQGTIEALEDGGGGATIEIVDVVTIEPGEEARVENTGTDQALKLVFYIPKGADGVTPTIDPTTRHWMIGGVDTGILAQGSDGQDGQDGAPGHNPCLGRFNVLPTLSPNPFADARNGDYIYFDTTDSQTSDPVTYIYHFDGTNWDAQGTVVDVSNLTFATNEEVTNVAIDGTGLANPLPNALAKAGDVKEKIDELRNAVGGKLDSVVEIYEDIAIESSGEIAGYIGTNGIVSTLNLYVKKFPVVQGDTYHIKGGFGAGSSSRLYAYYNEDTFLQSYDSADGQQGTTKEYDVTIPTEGTITHIAVQGGASNIASCVHNVFVGDIDVLDTVVEDHGKVGELETGLSNVNTMLEEELKTTVTLEQTWDDGKVLSGPTVGSEPDIIDNNDYKCCYIQNLKSGDVVNAHFRSSYGKRYCAKLKNGLITEVFAHYSDTVLDRTWLVDNTFDAIILNNYYTGNSSYVANPTAEVVRDGDRLDVMKNEIEANKEEIDNLQEQVDTIIEQGVSKEYNILCFGNSFTEDTISYVPFLLREAEPTCRFNFYFTYMGGMPISQCRAFVGGSGTESIVYNASGVITNKYANHGGYDSIYKYENGEYVLTTAHKSYTLYKLPWNATAWTSQSEPTIETAINILGEGKKWDLVTIQQGGTVNYRTWDWYYKPYVYAIYAELKKRLNYNFKIGYLMTHGAYANTEAELLSNYNGVVVNATKIMENTPTEVLLPYATALQNARTTYLKRFGSYVMDGAKLKNGIVVETFKKTSSGNINITCDGTFDAVILNNDKGVVLNPSCTKNGTTQAWNDGVMYGGLYQYSKPIERSSTSYQSLYLTELVEGDVIVSDNNTDDVGVCLLTDTAHVADGIGCLTCSYSNALAILEMIGSDKSIIGSQIVPDTTWLNEHNIPGASRVYGLTSYNIWLAQQCAVMAKKYPLQITDMVAKGMCGGVEIEIEGDGVKSSNSILSANEGEKWETVLSASDGYTISSVTVMMGVEDITATTYTASTNTVSIPNVTEKVTIVVVVVATE